MYLRTLMLAASVGLLIGCGGTEEPAIGNLTIDNSYDDSYFLELPEEIESVNDIVLDGFDYALTGTADSPSDLVVMKLDWDLSSTWVRPFGGNHLDEGRALQSTSTNGLIVSGYKHTAFGNTDAYLIKIDSMRQVEWELEYGDFDDQQAYSVAETSDNGFIFTGNTRGNAFGLGAMYVTKIDGDGNEAWTRSIDFGVSSSGRSVLEVQPELFLVSGTSFYSSEQGKRCFARIDISGNVLDSVVIDLPGESNLTPAMKTIQTRNSDLASITTDGAWGDDDIMLIRMSPFLDVLEMRTIGGRQSEQGKSIIEMSNADLLLLGTTTTFGNGETDILMIRMSSDGEIKWSHTYGGPGFDTASDVIENRFGSIIVCGYSASYGGPIVFRTDAMGVPEG